MTECNNENLHRLSDDWNGIKEVVLFGAGIVARICQPIFERVNVQVSFLIDNDKEKQGKKWNGRDIISYEDAGVQLRERKIVIMAAHTAYNEISEQLTKDGYTEYKDYCGIGQFLCEWYWTEKKMNCLYHVDMSVTSRCTFKCKHCNMFIPYYDEQKDFSLKELCENVDLLFSRVDYVAYFGLVGGEPTLNPHLEEILRYIGEKYREKCGRLTYVINGSRIPTDETLNTMKEFDIYLLISDYTNYIPYQNKIDELTNKLDQYGLEYDIRYSQVWADFGFPNNPVKRNEKELEEHLHCCHPEWNGLNDGKFYYCNISWSAEKSGHFRLKDTDYINLKDIDPSDREACRKIVDLSRGTSSFCRICGGCGSDNKKYVNVGEQM